MKCLNKSGVCTMVNVCGANHECANADAMLEATKRYVKGPSLRWEVQTWSLLDGWTNCWLLDDQPQIFESYEDALAELEEHIRDSEEAAARGDLDEPYSIEEYRIEEVWP